MRRFPPPWTVEETDACFIVRDHGGQALACVYFEEEPGRRAAAHLRRGVAHRGEHRLLQKPRASIDPTSAMTSTPDILPDCAH